MLDEYHSLWDAYSAVIFDFDDTLSLTMKSRWAALTAAAQVFGFEIDDDMIKASWGKPFNELISDLLPDVNLHTFVELYRRTMRQFPPVAAPGAVALLEYLRGRQIPVEIVTSSSSDLVRQDLDSLSLTEYFDDIWGFEETSPYSKPNVNVLRPVIAKLHSLGLPNSLILYIGDSLRDWEVASGNALKFIAVTSGLDGEDMFRSHGLRQECIVRSLEQLVPD